MVKISEVEKGSVADKKGIKQGDILEIQLGSKPFKAEILQINEFAKKEDAPLMYRTIE